MSDLSVILDRLPKLSATDLVKVGQAVEQRRNGAAKALASLGGGGNDNTPIVQPITLHGKAEPWGEVLLDCIIEVTTETVGYPISKETLRGMTAYQSFRKKLPALIKYIEHAAPEYVQRRAICKLGIELLFGYLHSPDRMTGPSTLLYQIHRMPAALDAQFPGYAGAGLLGLIVRSR